MICSSGVSTCCLLQYDMLPLVHHCHHVLQVWETDRMAQPQVRRG